MKEERPDGSAHNSFPSGHTATAFLGAEIGYWTLKPVKRLFDINLPDDSTMSMVPVADAFTGTYVLALAVRF